MSKNYLIDHMHVNKNRIEVFACRRFKRQWLLDDFFVEYDDDLDLGKIDYSILQIPFLLNVMPIVWLSGEEYHIKFLDEDLARSLQELREAFQTMYPNVAWNGELIGDKLVSNTQAIQHVSETTDDSVAVLFSGGVDSVCTSFRHIDKPQVLITIWGANVALENESGWAITRDQCKQFGLLYGHDNAFIKSNFCRFLYTSKLKTFSDKIENWWTHVQHGLGLGGLTAPILEKWGCTNLLIASTHTREFQAEWGSDYSIDNKLCWAGISVTHNSFDWSRQAKLRFIKSFCRSQQKPRPTLTVCMKADTRTRGDNCGRCEKCLRTITGLLIEGEHIQDYGFEISFQEAVTLIKEKFTARSLPIDENGAFFWKDLQARIREILSRPNGCYAIEHDLIPYFQWLSSFDFDEYRMRYEKNSQPHCVIRMIKKCVKALVIQSPMLGRKMQKWKEQYHYRSACKRIGPLN